MTTQQAIELLQTLRNTCAAADGRTGVALDIAIEVMKRSIVKADIESIIKAVTRETGVTEEEMFARVRAREYVDARAIVSWLAYHYAFMTLTTIGCRFGRTHGAVKHYNEMVDSWLDEPRLNIKGARITTKLINELEDGYEENTDDLSCTA